MTQEAVIATISGNVIPFLTSAPVAVQWEQEGISSAWLRKPSKLSPWYYCISQEHPAFEMPFPLVLGVLEAAGSQKISIFNPIMRASFGKRQLYKELFMGA